MSNTRISVITVVMNSVDTIEGTLRSVRSQTYPDIEHIVIDGGSTDGTLEILERHRAGLAGLVSGPDKGIYDAINKGFALATGDVLGILHSDDCFADGSVLETVAAVFADPGIDSCYGDLVYVDRGTPDRVTRYWKAGEYERDKFRRGWMPPHPTFFARKKVYEEYGGLDPDFPLAADYELMLRLLYKHRVSSRYVPRTLVRMKTGGTSRPGAYTFKSMRENYLTWKKNGMRYPAMALLKPVLKAAQYIKRPGE